MAVPTLRVLRGALPDAEIWAQGRWVESILETEPSVDRRLTAPKGWRGRLGSAGTLRRVGVDLAVLLPNSLGAALEAWLTGARWRVGYTGDGRSSLLTHPVRPHATIRHQAEAYLGLLAPLGLTPPLTAPTLLIAPERQAEARRLLGRIGLRPQGGIVGIQLGAAFGPSKLWAPTRLAGLALWLEARGVPVVFLGTASATPLLREVQACLGRPPTSLVGQDRPEVLPALLSQLAVLVAPDSGPAHVAAAVGIPVVTLFGPTDPRLTAPLGDGHLALWRQPPCAPCFVPRCPIDHRCLEAIRVEEVGAAVWARLVR
jgi:heptosyltransferase-2